MYQKCEALRKTHMNLDNKDNHSFPPSVGILDNDDLVLPILEDFLLARFGSESVIWTVTNGINAIELCSHPDTRPDVMLCDMSLEGVSGCETAKAIHQCTDAVDIIGITSFSLNVYRSQAITCGMQALTPKSDIEAIYRLINVLTHSHTPEIGFENAIQAHMRLSKETHSLALLLTRTEALIIEQVAHGMSNQNIANNMQISVNTVKTHLKRICSKLGARDRTQAAVIWVQGYSK